MISFFIIIFVPIMLSFCALVTFQKVGQSSLEEMYGVSEPYSENYMMNYVQMWNHNTTSEFQQLAEIADKNPQAFLEHETLDTINEKLRQKNSFLVVRKGETIIYEGGALRIIDEEDLPDYKGEEYNKESGMYVDDESKTISKQVDFLYPDGDEGSAFLMIASKKMLPEIKKLLVDGFISVVLILTFTAGMLIVWVYKGIISPLKQLEQATINIKEGNLDFEISTDRKDEIGTLFQSFDKMRLKLKESAERQIISEKENKELISNIAHDLKTPITTVKGYSEGLLDGVADTPQKQEKYLRTINNKANEMDRLLNELTLYAKIDTNRIPYNFTKLNVSEFFNDCIDEIGMYLETNNIGLNYYNYVDQEVLIIADPEQLHRVISNIVGNSVKYLDKQKGQINIRVKDVGDFIQVELEDNGRGIAPNDLPYIFERFFRTDASRNSATGGSGIGLSIVKKIIEDHGGKIWATSKEAVGTIMYFVIRKYEEVRNDESCIDY